MMRALLSLLAISLLSSSSLLAVESAEYLALRAARPDGRKVAVKNLTVTRDAYRVHFDGTFHFISPVGGRTFGAVFVGKGDYELHPASGAERRQLSVATNTRDFEVLTDTFDRMVILFSDGTAEEIGKAGTVSSGAADARALQLFEEYLSDQKRKYQTNFHIRLLQDVLNSPPSPGVFIAAVDGAKYAPSLLVFDPHGISSLAARFGDLSGETTAFLSYDNENGGL